MDGRRNIMLNHIVLMGRLTRDPELRRTPSGTAVASFTLAVDRDFASRESGKKETDFIDIVAWKHTAEFVSKYFSKGQMAAVSGRLQIRDWTDKDGGKRRNAEVVAENVYFADSKSCKSTVNIKNWTTTTAIFVLRRHVNAKKTYDQPKLLA